MPQAFFVLMRKLCNFSFSIVILTASLVCAVWAPALQAEKSNLAGLLTSGQTQSASASATSSNPVKLSAVDAVIQQAIADNNIPGAVLLVGHDGKVIYRKAYGHRSLDPKRELMTLDTIFDLASLTKVIAGMPLSSAGSDLALPCSSNSAITREDQIFKRASPFPTAPQL